MKLQRLAVAVAGAGMLAATAASGPALATTQNDPTPSWAQRAADAKEAAAKSDKAVAAEAECIQSVVYPQYTNVTGTVDVTPAKPPRVDLYDPFNFGASRYTATWYAAANASATQYFAYGVFLASGNLYRHSTTLPATGEPKTTRVKIGSGWSSFRAIATSNYNAAAPTHSYLYGLNTNGKLYRYAKNGNTFTYKSLGSFGGYASFKGLTVISETATYDTLLLNTRAGGLYTIRIPLTASAKPVLKTIRSSGWGAYESLATQACGNRGGTLVIGVDHDTNSGYQYAFGHANGTATAITAYGKIPTVFDGIDHAPFTWYKDNLNGE